MAAEEAGWDGFFLWDHLLWDDPEGHVADPTVVISAVAARTERIRIAIMVNSLARRRAAKVARETATLDVLTAGRLIVGAGLGTLSSEFTAFGESGDPRVRAARLDESLHLLDASGGQPVTFHGEYLTAAGVTMLPRPVQRPRIPIWCGGDGRTAAVRRAARWDGVMPIHTGYGLGETMPPAELRAVLAYTQEHRTQTGRSTSPWRGAPMARPRTAAGSSSPPTSAPG